MFAAFQPTSPGVLPVSVPFNPSKKNSGSVPTLKIPMPQRTISQQNNQESSPPSSTSTPTNPTTVGPLMSQSGSEPSSPGLSPNSSDPAPFHERDVKALDPSRERKPTKLENAQPVDGSLTVMGASSTHGVSDSNGSKPNEDEMIEPYVDFTDFHKTVEELGEDVVYSCDKLPLS